MNGTAIETIGLRKQFGATIAVDSLSLSVGRGEVFGFLGPNGSGKTTTIKMLLGLVHPSAGRAHVLGHAPGEPAAMGRIGFLPEHFRFPPWLKAAEFLDHHGRLYGMPPERRRRRIPELLDRMGLGDRAGTKLGEFSKGMSQRIGLAQALLNDPELVILDEPTSGLDPLGRRQVMEMIRELRRGGVTVFLNSHLLGEVESTCERVGVIKNGRVARIGTLDELTGPRLEVEVHASALTPELLRRLERWGRVARADSESASLIVDDRESLPAISAALIEGGARLYSIHPRRMSLEELFLRIMEET